MLLDGLCVSAIQLTRLGDFLVNTALPLEVYSNINLDYCCFLLYLATSTISPLEAFDSVMAA